MKIYRSSNLPNRIRDLIVLAGSINNHQPINQHPTVLTGVLQLMSESTSSQ